MEFCLIIASLVFGLANVDAACLQHQCSFSSGLLSSDIPSEVNKLINGTQKSNLVKIATWSVLALNQTGTENWDDRNIDLCEYIKKLDLTVFALQKVTKSQLSYLASCLPLYSFVGSAKSSSINSQYNPIFYKHTKFLNKIESGTFWLSETPNIPFTKLQSAAEHQTCTWLKVQFAVKLELEAQSHQIEPAINKLLRLLKSATDKRIIRPQTTVTRKRVMYSWRKFYVATTQLSRDDAGIAKRQVEILLDHLSNKIMDRRSYPVILAGNINWEQGTTVYNEIKGHRLKLVDMMDSSKKSFPKPSVINVSNGLETPNAELSDQVWSSGFTNILAATLMDKRSGGEEFSDHRAVFAAVLPEDV